MPIEPIEQYLQRTQGHQAPRPFSTPVAGPAPPGGEDPGVVAGFVGSLFSSVPELFGAPPSQLAEGFRTQHPVAGFVSELGGAAIPYLGAERIAQLPKVAPLLETGISKVLGRFGLNAADNPIAAGITRELIVNAPVEASRLAVGTAMYPDNTDLWADVGVNYALTGGIGGLAGMFRMGGKVLEEAGKPRAASIFLAPTHQLKMVVDDGASVANATPEELIPKLRNEVFTETPGTGGASKKPLDYVVPLTGMTAEQTKGISSLFEVGRETVEDTGKVTGLVKQTLNEGRGADQLKDGELQNVVDMLPESFKDGTDIAKNVQYPRRLLVADEAGARKLSGIASNPAWQQVSDRLSLLQERDGAFVFKYKLADGTGKVYGKGAGKAKIGEQYLIGKTVQPAVFDPKAAKLADLVTARWAKWAAPFAPHFNDVFSQEADKFIKAMSVLDYHNMTKMPEGKWKAEFSRKVGAQLAKEDGFLDTKFGYANSKTIKDLADNAYAAFKPTEFLQRQNPVYGRFFGLMRSAYRTADNLATRIVRGQAKLRPGTSLSKAVLGKGLDYESGFLGNRPMNEIINDLTDEETNLMVHLSGTDKLSDDGLEQLIKDGDLSRKGAGAIKEFRKLNEDVLHELVLPVFQQTGHDVDWLENHLGIPHIPRGDLFYTVTDAAGNPKHLAFGKNGAQAMREAKVVQETAKAAGRDWKIEAAKPKHIAAESEDALEQLGKQIFQNIQKTPEEGEVIYKAMRRLSTIKATSGRNPAIPVSSGMFKGRTAVSTSFKGQQFTKQDTLNAMEGHLKQLLHFAGMQSYKERFGSIAAHMLRDQDPKLFGDLIRKGNQMLGIEGKFTNALNDTLRSVLPAGIGGSKPATKIASAVNHYMAVANIFWLNPTFAVLNLLTPLQTVAPWIAHMRVATKEDLAKTTFMQLQPAFNAQGKVTGISAWTDPMKILGQSVQLMRNPTPELKAMYEQADSDGVFHPQIFEEWLGRHTRSQQTLGGAFKEDGIGGFLKQMATFPSDASEKFSRLSAFNSGYLVGKHYFNLEGDALYRFARRAVEITQFNYSTMDRSRIFTGPVGSMFGLFKNWQMHFMGNMMQYAGLAIKGQNFAPLTWTVGSALALGGLGATPLLAIADGLGAWGENDRNGFLWTQNHFGPEIGDAIYYGLPSFLGVSLQASASIPGTDVRNETASLFSFAAWQRAKQLGKAIGDADAIGDATGYSGWRNPQVRDELWSAIMPRFATKLFSAVEGDYVKSMTTGSPMVRDVSPTARLLTAAGFNPIETERYQTASRLAYKDQQARQKLVEGLGRAYSDAMLNGDWDEVTQVSQRAIAAGELDSVLRSAATRNTRQQSSDILSRYDQETQNAYRQVLAPR